jgi:hypothetical protein
VRLLRASSEDEVVAAFLRAEIDSERFGPALRESLARDGLEPRVLSEPDLADAAANAYRHQLLEEHRAWIRRDGLFGGFPKRLDWFRAALGPDEVLNVLYIDWDWWLMVSGGTRRATAAAERIRRGEIEGTTAEGLRPIAAALQSASPPPELVVVTTSEQVRLVLLEGHVRLTAYALFPELLPAELEVLVGVSDEVARWWAW